MHSFFVVFGPLVFWSLMFLVGVVIRIITFNDFTSIFHLSTDAALWSAGILFGLAVSEDTYFRTKIRHGEVSRNETGFTLNYEIAMPTRVGFNPKYIYLFTFSVAIWILNLLLGGIAAEAYVAKGNLSSMVASSTAIAFILASFIVTIAIKALREVSR